jgi:hypothetical protein
VLGSFHRLESAQLGSSSQTISRVLSPEPLPLVAFERRFRHPTHSTTRTEAWHERFHKSAAFTIGTNHALLNAHIISASAVLVI